MPQVNSAETYPNEIERPELRTFRQQRFDHATLRLAYREVRSRLRPPCIRPMPVVTGMTGSGKSTLLQLVLDDLSALPTSQGGLNCVLVEAREPITGGRYELRDLLRQVLTGYETVGGEMNEEDRARLDAHRLRAGDSVDDSYCAFLRRHAVRAVLVDEGHRCFTAASDTYTWRLLSGAVSLVNRTQIPHVFAGDLILAKLAIQNAHTIRRSSEPILIRSYPRSRHGIPLEFQRILHTFQVHLPLSSQPDLDGNLDYYHYWSCGSIGVLHDWLVEALKQALEDSRKNAWERAIEQHRLDHRQREKLEAEQSRELELIAGKTAGPTRLQRKPAKQFDRNKFVLRSPARDRVGAR